MTDENEKTNVSLISMSWVTNTFSRKVSRAGISSNVLKLSVSVSPARAMINRSIAAAGPRVFVALCLQTLWLTTIHHRVTHSDQSIITPVVWYFNYSKGWLLFSSIVWRCAYKGVGLSIKIGGKSVCFMTEHDDWHAGPGPWQRRVNMTDAVITSS